MSFQVSPSFLKEEEKTNAEFATLGQKKENLRTELPEHIVNAMDGISRPVYPNQKGRQNAAKFCIHWPVYGHSPDCCRKRMRDEVLEQIGNERTAKKVTFTHDYSETRTKSLIGTREKQLISY